MIDRITLCVLFVLFASVNLVGGSRCEAADLVPRDVDFERHVAPLLSRLGCNAGACHGSANGKGGFRLSLFGYDRTSDYQAITKPNSGRVDVDDPNESLLLAKPTHTIDHEGGRRIVRGSWEYRVLKDWIRSGARHVVGSGQLSELTIEPSELELSEASPHGRLRVMATFENGESIDVTSFSSLRVQDETIVSVDQTGSLNRRAPGETPVIASYGGRPASMHVLVPRTVEIPSSRRMAVSSQAGEIDRHIEKRLDRLGVLPSPRCTDQTFVRRVFLSTIGQLPTPDEIRTFVEDRSPTKRVKLIDRLLCHPLHASMLATRICEITGSGEVAERVDQEKWHAWFRHRLAHNVPYDQIARDVLTATTRNEQSADHYIKKAIAEREVSDGSAVARYIARPTLDLYWQRATNNEQIDIEAMTERTSAAFLGVRIECARCHKHPFDRWTQSDHRALGNVFVQVRFGLSPVMRSQLMDTLEMLRQRAKAGESTVRVPRMREVFVSESARNLRDPVTQRRLPSKPLGAESITGDVDRRIAFVDWLTRRGNPYFASNFVNRLWAHYFGIGLVEPVDSFSGGNPPSHPKLLAALARDFEQNGYDIRHIERLILLSAAWQRSSRPNLSNQSDTRNYARAYPRVLPAAVIVDALSCAIGDQLRPAVAIGSRLADDEEMDTYLKIFSRPERKATCDCERVRQPTLRQTMLLLSDRRLSDRIDHGVVAGLGQSIPDDQLAISQLFLRTLSRMPDDRERDAAVQHLNGASDRLAGLSDVMWSLLNTREFVTNH